MLLEKVYPQPHAQRQVLALRHQGVDAIGRGREGIQDRLQAPGLDIGLDFPEAAPGQTQAGQTPLMQDLAIAAVQPPLGAPVIELAVHPEGPAAGLAGLGGQAQRLMPRQLAGMLGHTGAPEIGRRGHAQAPVVGQTHAHQAGIRQIAHAHRAVETLVDDVHHPIREIEREAQILMPGEELRHQGRHMAAAEAGRRRDAQMAAGLDAPRADPGLGIGKLHQQALAVLQKAAALMGEGDAPGGAHQQLHAQAFLQRVDAPTHHRGRHALGLGGGREAALGGDQHKGFDLFQAIHGGDCALSPRLFMRFGAALHASAAMNPGGGLA